MRASLLNLSLLIIAMNSSAQTFDRTKPPATAPQPEFHLPPVYETVLSNGLRVVLVEDARFPLVTVRLGFLAGARVDPQDLPGLSEAAGALLTEGTETRTSRQIAEQLAAIGGSLKGAASADSLTLYGNSLAEHIAILIDLLADVSRKANFPEEEVAIHKNRRTQELLAERSEAAYWADEKFASVVFGSHPYSRLNPTPESIEKLDRQTLAGFRDSFLLPNNAVLILLGALPPRAQALKLVTEKFGDWPKKELPETAAAAFPKPSRSILLVDRPGSVQADVRVGQLAVDRSHADYFPLVVANTILGGGASSRMFTTIREDKGFAYDAHSSFQPRRNGGLFAAVTQVRNEVIEPALDAVQTEMEKMASAPVAAEELTNVKNYLSGTFVMSLETQNGLAGQLLTVKLMGLPNDHLEKYTTRIRSVEPQQIQAAARKYIAPKDAGIVVVGDASQIQKALERLGKVTVVKAE